MSQLFKRLQHFNTNSQWKQKLLQRNEFSLMSSAFQSSTATTNATDWEQARPFNEVPGYTKWNLLRAFMPGGEFHKKDFVQVIGAVNKAYGAIARFPGIMGNPDMVFIYKPDDFETVFRNEGPWPLRRSFQATDYHRRVLRKDYFNSVNGIMSTNGQQWSDFRTIVNPVLMQPKTVSNYLGRMSVVSADFVERIREIRSSTNDEVPANFLEEIHKWTLESVTVVALDKHLSLLRTNSQDPDVVKFFKNINAFFALSCEIEMGPPVWKYIQTSNFKALMKVLDEITAFVDKYIQEALQRMNSENYVEKPEAEQSVVEKLLKIDPKVATVMAMDMLFAGVDTTASAFTSVMLCLAKFPEKQEKLREEVLTAVPHKDSPLTVDNMKNLPYLRACLKESQRVYPLIPGILRGSSKDIVVHGYRIPKGTDIVLANFQLLIDSEYFPNPREFVPERWLRQDDEVKKCDYIGSKSHPFAYFPFGFGPRSCVGKRIANMELEIGLCQILRNFRVEFNYPADDVFKNMVINVPVKPLKFAFKDL